MEYRRLFDCVAHQLANFPTDAMLVSKIQGEWVKNSTQQVADTVNLLSAGLLQLGVSGHDFTP